MKILGIDTTGFSTSVALVENGSKVILNYVGKGYNVKKNWDEVSKELPQHHFHFLMEDFDKILNDNKISWDDIDAIAVSNGSGIDSCLMIGNSFASNFSKKYSKPLIKVDHVLAHLRSCWIDQNEKDFTYPILAFSASGSHNNFILMPNNDIVKALPTKMVTNTEKDVTFNIGIGKYFFRMYDYLGFKNEENGWGKFLMALEEGDENKYNTIDLGVKRTFEFNDRIFDFTDLMYGIKNFIKKRKGQLSKKERNDLSAVFQKIITNEICNVLSFLIRLLNVNELHISGGISMNAYIEKRIRETMKKEFPELQVRLPKIEYRQDNAAMIASLAYYQDKDNINYKYFHPIITK